jgi:hypothetical protein
MSIKNEDEILEKILGDTSSTVLSDERLCFYARINSIVDIKKELLEKTHEIDSNTFTDLANKYKQRIIYNTKEINEANCSQEFSRYSIDDFFKVLLYIQNKKDRGRVAKAGGSDQLDIYILLDTDEKEIFIDEDFISLIIMIENYNNDNRITKTPQEIIDLITKIKDKYRDKESEGTVAATEGAIAPAASDDSSTKTPNSDDLMWMLDESLAAMENSMKKPNGGSSRKRRKPIKKTKTKTKTKTKNKTKTKTKTKRNKYKHIFRPS